MTKPTVMPVGIIEQSTKEGAIFTLTRPGDPSNLKINSSVMARNTHRDDEDIPSGVMVRGQVTEIGPTTATFKVVELRTGPYWPKDADTLAPGCFVHLAMPDSSEIDRSQIATPDEEKFLEKLEMDRQFNEVRKRNDFGPPSSEPRGSEQE